MGLMTFIPVLISSVVYLAVLFVLFYLIFKWMNKVVALKQEQNDLLREIIRKMDPK